MASLSLMFYQNHYRLIGKHLFLNLSLLLTRYMVVKMFGNIMGFITTKGEGNSFLFMTYVVFCVFLACFLFSLELTY
jgi:hypothetical protein